MNHFKLLIDSLFYPKKLAAYRLLPIGKTLQYVFILVSAITIFSFIQFLMGVSDPSTNIQGLTEYIEDIIWLLYPFAFILLFLTSTVVIFVRISIYAFVGIVILKILNRRGEYRHMWRTASLAITWSTLLSILFSMLQLSSTVSTMIGILITIILLVVASAKYPKIPKK
ncbi:DUF1189 domain-containing protein [Lysinibacillus yapensis]|uniref:DUF1189 domain-containing protein n=2 Tax=Ureibacillus yapensis TaxID=2304605 RepID=A0A396SCK5_9BACL|nr:DUF1189 domain-containing protein [Lysinibacillus yapensis]